LACGVVACGFVRIGPDLCRTSLGGRLPGAKDQQQGEDRCDSGEGRPHYSQVVPAGGVRACVCRVTLSCFQHAVRRPSPASTGGGARWGPAALALSRDAGTGVTRWPTQRRAQGPGAKASVGFELRTADSMPVLYRIPCTATYSATQLRPGADRSMGRIFSPWTAVRYDSMTRAYGIFGAPQGL
jgi:hypothetical protein